MTDANIVSIAITLFAIAAGSIFNNVRISDTATALNKRIDDTNRNMDQRAGETARGFAEVARQLDRIEQTLTAVLGDHEKRIRELEHLN